MAACGGSSSDVLGPEPDRPRCFDPRKRTLRDHAVMLLKCPRGDIRRAAEEALFDHRRRRRGASAAISMPSVLAVLRLTTSLLFVGACTGRLGYGIRGGVGRCRKDGGLGCEIVGS